MIRVTVVNGPNGQGGSWLEEWDATGWVVETDGRLKLFTDTRDLDGRIYKKTVVEYAPLTWRSVCPKPQEVKR